MKKALTIIGIVLVVVAAGYLVVIYILPGLLPGSGTASTTSTYQTAPAEVGSLTATVGATGSVQSFQTALITWGTSGTVDTVDAVNGAHVQAGDRLASLKQSSLSQNIIMAQVDLVNAQNALSAAINNSEARAQAQLTLVQAEKALDTAQKESESMLYQRAGQNTIDIAKANLILAENALSQAEDVYNANKNGSEENYAAALTQLANARQKRDNAQYNLWYVEGLPAALDIQEANAKLELAKAQVQTAKTEWEKVKDGPNPDDVAAAQAKIASAQAALNQVRLTAPFSGTITEVDIKPGDLVNAGGRAFQIDDLSHLLIDVQVSEVDINRVSVGQAAAITFDAISGKEYTGSVIDIASAGSTSGGAVYFTVTVEISNPDSEVKPGMTAAVNLVVSQLEGVLLTPNKAVRVVDGKRLVYVLKNNQAVAVEITLGPSDDANSQVLSGDLVAGDAIILNPPSSTFGPGASGGAGGAGAILGGR